MYVGMDGSNTHTTMNLPFISTNTGASSLGYRHQYPRYGCQHKRTTLASTHRLIRTWTSSFPSGSTSCNADANRRTCVTNDSKATRQIMPSAIKHCTLFQLFSNIFKHLTLSNLIACFAEATNFFYKKSFAFSLFD